MTSQARTNLLKLYEEVVIESNARIAVVQLRSKTAISSDWVDN